MELAELNWKICIDYLEDAIEALAEVGERLDQTLENSQELRGALENKDSKGDRYG